MRWEPAQTRMCWSIKKKMHISLCTSTSPYENLKPWEYTDILLTTGLNDPCAAFWEPAKFAARLLAVKTSDSLVLLITDFNSGHGGVSGRSNALKDVAVIYAFLIDRIGWRNHDK